MQQQYDDEIDLFELAQDIWQEKILIASITLLVSIAAVLYALLATPTYQATATLLPPSAHMIQEYNLGRKEASLDEFSAIKIYEEFLTVLNSRQLKRKFMHEVYQPSMGDNLSEISEERLFAKMNSLLKIEQTQPKVNKSLYQVGFASSSPQQAADFANEYVAMALLETKAKLQDDIKAELQLRIDSAQAKITSLRTRAKVERENEISRLSEALQVADAIGLEAPSFTLGKEMSEVANYVDRNQLYLWGSKALRSRLQVLNSRKNDDPFIEGLRGSLLQVELLSQIKVDANNAQVATLDEEAKVPSSAIKPKKRLVVAVGFVAGAMLGLFISLIRIAIRKRQAQNA